MILERGSPFFGFQTSTDRSARLAELPGEIAALRLALESTEVGDSRDTLQQALERATAELNFLTESSAWFAREMEHVLDTPSPSVAFMNFGERSLNFDLRVFIRGAKNIVLVQSRIRYAIDAAFRKAGVEIALPRRDLHIRSLPECSTIEEVQIVLQGSQGQ